MIYVDGIVERISDYRILMRYINTFSHYRLSFVPERCYFSNENCQYCISKTLSHENMEVSEKLLLLPLYKTTNLCRALPCLCYFTGVLVYAY